MSAVKDRAVELLAALRGVEDVRAYDDPAAVIDPPGVVLGPPALVWETGGSAPTTARFLVYVVVGAAERAIERLWELVPVVAAALDTMPGVTVMQADPATYPTGGPELPCYQIQIEVSL